MGLLPFVGAHHDASAGHPEVNEGEVSPCGATYFARVGKVGKTPPGTRPSELRLHVVPPRFTRPLSPDPIGETTGAFHEVPASIARRRQDVRYALLAPLPLSSRRAAIPALTVQAPGLCGPCGQLPQLVGTRRGSETA